MAPVLAARTKNMSITTMKSTACFAAQVLMAPVPTAHIRNTNTVAARINASTVVQQLRGHAQIVRTENTKSKKRFFDTSLETVIAVQYL